MSRLRDEAIKAAEDKKEEEKKREEEEREKKPGKDGIRVRLKIFTLLPYSFLNCCRLQMLQNRLTVQKTSDSVKQLMFERDLELEMLRRKKHYQTSASGLSFFFLFFIVLLFLLLLSLSFIEKEKAIPNFCIRIVFLLYIYVESSNLQQDCFLMESFVAGY